MTTKTCKYCPREFLPNTPNNIVCPQCSSNGYKSKQYRLKNNLVNKLVNKLIK